MGADVELYEDPASLPYDGLVAAWHEVESRSSWVKARLAAAVPLGRLERFAKDVGVAYATVTHYRSVANAYPAVSFGHPKVSFGVAAALMAHPHRFELVSGEKPLTVGEARKLAKPDHLSCNGTGGQQDEEPVSAGSTPNGSSGTKDSEPAKATYGPHSPAPVQEPARQVQQTAATAGPGPEPHVHVYEMTCRCGARVPQRDVLAVVDRREAELEASRARVRELETEVASLRAQLSDGSGGSGVADPGNDGTRTPVNTAGSAFSEPDGQPERGGPCQHPSRCGSRGFPARAERADGGGKPWTGLLCGDCYGREEAKGGDYSWSRPAEVMA